MGTYIHFTEEQKRRANNVDLADFLCRQGETLLPSGREKRLEADHSITVRGNEWYDHAKECGGYAIDFVRHFYGRSFPEAVTMLLGGERGEQAVFKSAEKGKYEQKKCFMLPPESCDMRRMFAYLIKKRFVDKDVLKEFVKNKLLYESCEKSKDGLKEYHNAVFVGRDENGVARHAHKRGIYSDGTSFKGNIEGSNPAYSFHYIGNGSSERLYVFEAPIDMLSFITLNSADWKSHSYVALCGVGEQAMIKTLQTHPFLSMPILCLDNDAAGIAATERIAKILAEQGYENIGVMKPIKKDWNDDLKEKSLSSEPAPGTVKNYELCLIQIETNSAQCLTLSIQ